ncbi:hypothetical protein VKT23_012612 [Stygiomarasmius scandens]|uniref:F-box domain-containing protein n=1 Tax=Marasmiellus scandens TaxID=2682957 RepID=A0ABR1J899_9AGAR
MPRASSQSAAQNYTANLPPEILQHIFSFFCAIFQPLKFSSFPKQSSSILAADDFDSVPPLTLSHVCFLWRSILLSDTILWSRFEFRARLENIASDKIDSLLSLCNLVLSRSGQQPLDLVVEFTDPIFVDETAELPWEMYDKCHRLLPVYKALFQHAHRWRNVCLFLRRDMFSLSQYHRNPVWPETFPILESLAVHIIGEKDDFNFSVHPRMKILSAPHLHSITHTGLGVEILSEPRTPEISPLGSLRRFSFSDHLMTGNVSLASPITSLTIRRVHSSVYHGQPPVRCLAKSLSILSEKPSALDRNDGWHNLTSIISSLTLPNITSLHIEKLFSSELGWSRTDELAARSMFQGELVSLLNRSSAASITHFTMINIRAESEKLVHIISLLHSLSHLALGDAVYDQCLDIYRDDPEEDLPASILSPSLFRLLSCTGTDPTIHVPNLIELHVGFRSFDAKLFRAFLDTIETRRSGFLAVGAYSRLCLVQLKFMGKQGSMDVVITERIDKLHKMGTLLELNWAKTTEEWRLGLGRWQIENAT